MNETTRQRVWLVVVLALGIVNASQFVTTRNLRAELETSRAAVEQLRAQIDQRARQLVANTLRARRREMIDAAQWLHAFYQSDEGLQRREGLWIAGHPDFEGIGAWLFDVYLAERFSGTTDGEARQKVIEAIQQSDEWRQKHPGR